MQIALTVGAVLVLLGLWRAQKSSHVFNVFDMLINPSTGKASLNAVTLAVMALLAVWVTVDREQQGKDDVPSLLAMVLGIFVAGRVGAQAISAFKPGPDLNTTVERTQTEVVTKEPVAGT